jgi:hypothetical protein
MSHVAGHLDLRILKKTNLLEDITTGTGMELVLTGLGSTSSPLKDKIENKIPGIFCKT